MSTAASGFPAFLRSFDLPEPGELRRVARVYVWGRWFVLSIATFAWLYPLNVDEVVPFHPGGASRLSFSVRYQPGIIAPVAWMEHKVSVVQPRCRARFRPRIPAP